MKGPFSIWAFFGLTLWIDVFTHVFSPKKERRINPYYPVREVSVLIPVHKESEESIKKTIESIYNQDYPVHNVLVCGDDLSQINQRSLNKMFKNKNLHYIKSPFRSKAKKINYVIENFSQYVGDFVYTIDCTARGEEKFIEKMVSYFSSQNVAAVTSYGRVSKPKNFLSRSYFYGKAWVNEIGRFRKNAQEKRNSVFVICGASTMYRKEVLQEIPIPSRSKTEDTYYTWVLQREGYSVRVADDATVSAPEVDGEGMQGIKGQIKQSYRWSSGTLQCMSLEGKKMFKNKKLAYTTILPGFAESVMYTIPLVLLPILFLILPFYALGFLIGDTVFSLLGTLILMPKKFGKTIWHYPQIMFFKYVNAVIFLVALMVVTFQAIFGFTDNWNNEWISPQN